MSCGRVSYRSGDQQSAGLWSLRPAATTLGNKSEITNVKSSWMLWWEGGEVDRFKQYTFLHRQTNLKESWLYTFQTCSLENVPELHRIKSNKMRSTNLVQMN